MPTPIVAAVEMGYGHLRAAWPLADALGADVLLGDRAPVADAQELQLWARTRHVYEAVSRVSQLAGVGMPLRWLLDGVTSIPHLFPYRDMSAPTPGVLAHDRLVTGRGLGAGVVREMRRTGAALLTTFYTLALAAERRGVGPVYCVVTDTDVNRVWVPRDARTTQIVFLAPSERVVRRLQAYGVPRSQIRFTGFPLPGELLGGRGLGTLRQNLAARLVRLDPERSFLRSSGAEIQHFLGELPEPERGKPPLVTFAVGGAGAQAELAREFLPSLGPALRDGRLRLALVAGVRGEVEARFHQALELAGLAELLGGAIRIVREDGFVPYYRAFNQLLAETDVLWTKPSELVFYGALGLPLVLSRPVGAHERYNRRWAIERGAGLKQRDARFIGERLHEWLADGTLAAAAWSGFVRLPKFGLYEICDAAAPGAAG